MSSYRHDPAELTSPAARRGGFRGVGLGRLRLSVWSDGHLAASGECPAGFSGTARTAPGFFAAEAERKKIKNQQTGPGDFGICIVREGSPGFLFKIQIPPPLLLLMEKTPFSSPTPTASGLLQTLLKSPAR